MAIRKIKPVKAFERNADLMFNLMRYILDQPAIVRRLPKKFELVILPEDDPELMAYNLRLLQKYGSEGQPVVFVSMVSSRKLNFKGARPEVYAPVAV